LLHPKLIKKGLHLTKILSREGISVAHIFFNDASILSPLFCKLAGCKVIVSKRDLGFNLNRKQLFLLKLNNLLIDRVIVNSEAIKRMVCEKLKWTNRKKVMVIYNGIDQSKFELTKSLNIREQLLIPDEAPIVGIVANLNPWKRHIDLIKAFYHVKNKMPESHLVIIGDGKLKRPLQFMVDNLELKKAVHFAETINDVIPFVKEFSVGVLCSESEGFSSALLEYMACGKPVVATRVGGNMEVIEHGKNGFLVEVGDYLNIADNILVLLKNRTLSKKFGNCGKNIIRQRCNLEKMINLHISTYRNVLQNGKK
jgi:glycosyltransferase involved in cell wall biosynthesis